MKTDKHYKIKRVSKYIMGTIVNDNARNDFKNAMIEAHVFELATRPKSKKSKNDRDES